MLLKKNTKQPIIMVGKPTEKILLSFSRLVVRILSHPNSEDGTVVRASKMN